MEEEGQEIVEIPEGQGQTVVEVHVPATRGATRRQTATKKKAVVTPTKKTPKPKNQTKTKKPSAIQVVKSFMEEQSDVNRAILDQLATLRDKCGFASPGLNGGESSRGQSHGGAGNGNGKKISEPVPVTSESEESDVDSDMEARIQSDMNEAQACLQPKFVKNSGRQSNIKQIEQKVTLNRPYAFLDREKQRDLVRQNVHPEELDILNHVEGLIGMASAISGGNQVKGILNHIHQTVIDSQVHKWPRVRRWSNQVIFKVATGSWEWDSFSQIAQERNSQYVICYPTSEKEPNYPCFGYNKGDCKHENDHFSAGTLLAHICAFCYSLDGTKEPHMSKTCGKRRSSSNYFRMRDDNREGTDKKAKFRSRNNFPREEREDRPTYAKN